MPETVAGEESSVVDFGEEVPGMVEAPARRACWRRWSWEGPF